MLFSCETEFHRMWYVLGFYVSLHPLLSPLTKKENQNVLEYGGFLSFGFFVCLFSVSLFFFWSPAVHVGVETCGLYGKFCYLNSNLFWFFFNFMYLMELNLGHENWLNTSEF